MAPIGEEYLAQLRERGLLASTPFSAERTLAHGVWVMKPAITEGNSVPEYDMGYRDSSGTTPCNAPPILIIPEDGKWAVWMQEGIPAMRPGDFKNHWSTEQEAIDDVLDFYFGNPERMAAVR